MKIILIIFLLAVKNNTNGVYAETPTNFRALWGGNNDAYWEIEIGDSSEELKNSINALISCVKDTDDETFVSTIENHLDVQSAIDYYIQQYITGAVDNLARNMLLATYDGTKWYCGSYDMDTTFGMAPWDYACPEQYNEPFSLLWERIEKCFTDRVKDRYFELRKTVFSFSNITTKFERFMDTIGLDLYEEDATIYNIPSGTNHNIQYIRDFTRDRLTYVDDEILYIGYVIECEGIAFDMDEININEPTQLIATVTPSNTNEKISWESSDTTVATVDNGLVIPNSIGECTITVTCGNYSASCNITVELITLASQIKWKNDYFIGSNGVEYQNPDWSATPFIDLCGANHLAFMDYNNVNGETIVNTIDFYNSNKEFVQHKGSFSLNTNDSSISKDAVYARIATKTENRAILDILTDVDLNGYIKLDSSKFVNDKVPALGDDVVKTDFGYFDEFIPVSEGQIANYANVTHFFSEEPEGIDYNVRCVLYDSNKKYVDQIYRGEKTLSCFVIPSGVSYVKFVAHNATKDYRYYKILA